MNKIRASYIKPKMHPPPVLLGLISNKNQLFTGTKSPLQIYKGSVCL